MTRRRSLFGWLGTILLVGLDLILIGAFLPAYAARYLPADYWWADLAAVGLPVLSAALLVMTLLILVRGPRRLIGLHLGLLLLIGLRFGPSLWHLVDPPSSVPDATTLHVVSFNMPWQPPEEASDLDALVEATTPDLLAFQENDLRYNDEVYWTGPSTRALIESTALAPALPPGPDREGLDRMGAWTPYLTQTRQPVLSGEAVEVLEATVLPLPVHSEGLQVAPHVYRVRFRWQEREAVLYNLYLRSFGVEKPWDNMGRWTERSYWADLLTRYREAFRHRAEEVRVVRQLMEQETLPLLVMGDFNSTPHNWAHAHLVDGFQDAFEEAGTGWGATYHAEFPLVRIDHVLASPEWQVVQSRVVSHEGSDHRPLVVQLRWAVPSNASATTEQGP